MVDASDGQLDPATVLALAVQIHEDAERPADEVEQRDRAIASGLPTDADRRGRVVAWLDAAGGEQGRQFRTYTRRALAITAVLLGVLGLMAGGGTAAALFAYDGRDPINITWVLAIFVGVQVLIVLASLLAMLPGGLRRALPGWKNVQDGMLAFSPGQLVGLVGRFSPTHRQRFELIFGRARGWLAVCQRMTRWVLLQNGQLLGVMFNAGALLVAVALVTTTDLAFGWSTTLDIENATAHAIVDAIATPWAWAWPDGVPSEGLVTQTRYFRAGGPETSAEAALTRGAWWPFLVTAMLVYGLAPRFALWLIARWRARVAVSWTFDELVKVHRLDRRLAVAPASDQAEAIDANAGRPASELSAGNNPLVIAWADPPAVDGLAIDINANGATATARCEEVAGALTGDDDRAIVIVTRAWEPPVAELFDFIKALRQATSATRPIMLLPVGFADDGAVSDGDRTMWRRAVGRTGDAWMTVIDRREVTR